MHHSDVSHSHCCCTSIPWSYRHWRWNMDLSLHFDIEGSIDGVETHYIPHKKEVWDNTLQERDCWWHFGTHRATVKSYLYCTTLRYLKEAIQIKHPSLLTEKVILLCSACHNRTSAVLLGMLCPSTIQPGLYTWWLPPLWTTEKPFQG
jgi:hypothetical protein